MKSLIFLAGIGVITLLSEVFRFRKWVFPLMLLGLAGAMASAVYDWNAPAHHFFNNMLVFDNTAIAFTLVMCFTFFLWLIGSRADLEEHTHITDTLSLSAFALTGAMMMVSYGNLVMLFLGIETLSIPLYVLAGSRKNSLNSNEAALKYFLMGSFATGFLLMGIALVYGVTGAFHLHTIADYVRTMNGQYPPMFYLGVVLIFCAMAFKVSAAPFHFWAPDVYTGAPTQVTALMSTVVKTAAFAAFFRLFNTCFAQVGGAWLILAEVLAVLTLLVGNITALVQENVKRMLAYSSIAHAGYLMLGILSISLPSAANGNAILFYTLAYSLGGLLAFSVLYLVSESTQSDHAEAFRGLFRRNPFLAVSLSIALFSLAGIPPMAGFFGKYYLFVNAIHSGHIWVVMVAVLASLVGAWYYLRLMAILFAKGGDELGAVAVPLAQRIVIWSCLVGLLALGLFPNALVQILS